MVEFVDKTSEQLGTPINRDNMMAIQGFIGMTTDSRSILSFVRHDYFRRILCRWLDEKNTKDEWNLPIEYQREIIEKICYKNAKSKIKR